MANSSWAEGQIIGVGQDNTKYPTAIFINTTAGVIVNNKWGSFYGFWNSLDVVNGKDPVSGVSFNIPSDVKAVFLSGILIITMGATQQIADIALTFRQPGSRLAGRDNRMMQAVTVLGGAGVRTNSAAWVPCTGGRFEWYWWVNDDIPYGYPSYASYGVNLAIQGYLR